LTWNGRVSFVLTDALTLKKIKLLDVVLESVASDPGDDGFDADVALCTGELRRLVPDLLLALGGELMHKPAEAIKPAFDVHAEAAMA